jgi:hypothetical protein
MNDEELDRLVAASMMSDTTIDSLAVGAGEQALREEIMMNTRTTRRHSRSATRPRRLVVGLTGVPSSLPAPPPQSLY